MIGATERGDFQVLPPLERAFEAGRRNALRVLLLLQPASVRRALWALPVLVGISLLYAFLASCGTFSDVPSQLDYYDQMCEGFRRGHLYLVTAPSPDLLAAADPFRYENQPLWLWDATLFGGHYYLYWGPVPALLLWAYKVLSGSHERVTDQWPTVIFMLGRLWAGAGLILSLASRFPLRQSTWVCCLAIAVFGLANPTPFIVARPHVYEACLAGGQCFLFCGLLCAFWGLESRRWRRSLLCLAGISWALAIGCRVTSFICVPPLLLITAAFVWWRSNRALAEFVPSCLALGVPVAAATAAYGWYNFVRFRSVTEFGVTYQLTTQPFYGNASYVWPNVFSYLLAPLKWSCRFPFARITAFRELSEHLTWPPGYETFERVGGILYTTGWTWFFALGVWRVVDFVLTRRRPPSASNAASTISSFEGWLLLCAAASMLTMVPVLSLWEASMRYAEDALGGILLIATLGVFWALRRTYASRFRVGVALTRALVVLVGLQTCVIGAATAFTTYNEPFQRINPKLFGKLERALSVCSLIGHARP